MVTSNKIDIKTKYATINECRDNCRDIKKKMVIPFAFSRKIYGEVFEDNTFTLSSRGKFSTIYKFVGHIESRSDGIYMCGNISVKKAYKILLPCLGLLFIIAGLIMIFTGGLFLIFYGLFFVLIGWIYFYLLGSTNILYKDLLNKLQ